uniref:Uncharacterized protein n=1 Tax=mine drainage metagenome TaxID=410659 RepID=E6PFP7_9ZZZZ
MVCTSRRFGDAPSVRRRLAAYERIRAWLPAPYYNKERQFVPLLVTAGVTFRLRSDRSAAR